MNKLPVYLYPNLLNVILDLDENRGINKVMYQRKIKIQRGFKNTLQIQFRNSDQKPISVTTSSNYYFDLIDSQGRELVISKQLEILDDSVTTATRGLGLLTLDPEDTFNLVANSYKFVVKQQNEDGSFTPTYSNTYYGVTGDLEVVEDGIALGYPTQTVTFKQLESGQQYNREPSDLGYMFVSSWLRPAVRSTQDPQHSMATIYLASFNGRIIVEGTLDNSPSSPGHANAEAVMLTQYVTEGVEQGSITLVWDGAYTAVRFKVKPVRDTQGSNYYPTGNPVGSFNNKFPSGFVDQIVYIS